MGDPKKLRKKYETPSHPWQKSRIVEEIKYLKEYGLKNKKNIWKFSSFLKNYKDQAKKLIAMQGKQADIERAQMMDKLKQLGLIKAGNETYDAIFSLQVKDVLDRMLQTIIYKKELARSTKQARQFIVHGHVMVGDKKITSPRYIVSAKEESLINFNVNSSIYDSDHPERPKPDLKKLSEMKEEVSKIKVETKTNIEKKETKKEDNKIVDSDNKESSKKSVKESQDKESKEDQTPEKIEKDIKANKD
jgi:small subunit ribosomal protein S4